MNRNPRVTVLMSVRNGEPYIYEAVDSILNQTYENYSFLILDNASTDNTRSIIQDFKDSRIKLVELSEDIGQTSALNKGLDMVYTKFVARMDADDFSFNNRLELQMAFMQENPEIVLLGTNYFITNEQGKTIVERVLPLDHQNIIDTFVFYNPFAHSSVLFNRKKILEVGGYPEEFNYSQDKALWMKISQHYKVANLPSRLIKIRHHSNQASSRPELLSTIKRDAVNLTEMALNNLNLSTKAKKKCLHMIVRTNLGFGLALLKENKYLLAYEVIIKIFVMYPSLTIYYLKRKLMQTKGNILFAVLV